MYVAQEKECAICFGELSNSHRLQLCGHKFCTSCLESQIHNALKDISELPIKCGDCQKLIALRDIRDIIQYDVLKKLYEASYKDFLQKNSEEYKNCPTPNCKQIFAAKIENDRVECDTCLKSYCRKCLRVYHEGLTCEQYSKQIEDEKDLDKQIKNMNIKKCPKCKRPVEKNEGCNHMTCICKCEFCWLCLASFERAEHCYSHIQSIHERRGRLEDNDGFRIV